jgi:hypothetical protein
MSEETPKKPTRRSKPSAPKDLCPFRPGGGVYELVTEEGERLIATLGPARVKQSGKCVASLSQFRRSPQTVEPETLKAAGWVWLSGGIELK